MTGIIKEKTFGFYTKNDRKAEREWIKIETNDLIRISKPIRKKKTNSINDVCKFR
jgi:hypothetical protein